VAVSVTTYSGVDCVVTLSVIEDSSFGVTTFVHHLEDQIWRIESIEVENESTTMHTRGSYTRLALLGFGEPRAEQSHPDRGGAEAVEEARPLAAALSHDEVESVVVGLILAYLADHPGAADAVRRSL